jgi:hypothetical protein
MYGGFVPYFSKRGMTSTQVFLGLLVSGEGLRSHEILHRAVILELVLNKVCMG